MNKLNLEDHELLQLIKQGDRHSFKIIFNRYWKRLYSYAYKIYSDHDICDDCVQELFVTLWEKRKHLAILNLEAYLFKAIRYQVSKHAKHLNFNSLDLNTLNSLKETGTQTTMEYKELEENINSKITELPIRCREVFELSRFQHKTNAEIASQLQISIRTVETHISHALKQLRSQLGESLYFIILIITILP